MLNLQVPALDPAVCLTSVVSAKTGYTRKLLDGCSTKVTARYAEYDRLAPTFVGLAPSPLGKRQQGAMKKCYIRGRKRVDELFEDLCAEQEGHLHKICPLCGRTGSETADHALPEGEFPEFAVYPKNLIPACETCNTKKNKKWRDARGRLFLHAYFDQVPTEKFLYVDVLAVAATGVEIQYRVSPPATVAPELAGVLLRHFEELKLATRYLDWANTELGVWGNAAEIVPNRAAAEFRDELSRDHDVLIHTWGPNQWEVALLAALRDSAPFTSYLEDIAAGRIGAP